MGLIPIVIRNVTQQNYSSLLPTIQHILDRSKAVAILTSHSTIRQLKSKEISAYFDIRTWPPLLDLDDVGRRKIEKIYHPPTSELIAYIDYTVSSTGVLTGTKVSPSELFAILLCAPTSRVRCEDSNCFRSVQNMLYCWK